MKSRFNATRPPTEPDRLQQTTRRMFLIGAGQIAVAGLYFGRLWQLQVARHSSYELKAEENRISLQPLPAHRGVIYDRFGVPLALNQPTYQITLTREEAEDVQESLRRVAQLLNLPLNEVQRIQAEIKKVKRFVPVVVKSNIAWEEMARVEVLTPELSGVHTESIDRRLYPLGAATGHVLGYVGPPNEEELKTLTAAESAAHSLTIGKVGIEKTFDTPMRGQTGAIELEVNARGRAVRELSRREPVAGQDLRTTLDAELQQYLQERLSTERSAAALVMDAFTGAVYALGSYPSFDPNHFVDGIDKATWQSLMQDVAKPMLNKVYGGSYPPGSTYKLMTAIAALQAGVADPHSTVFCPGYMTLGNHQFHCWKKGGHGTVDLTRAIGQSCDVYFYEMGRRMGSDKMAETSLMFGLGQVTGIGLAGEKPGLIPHKEWLRKTYHRSWQGGDTLVTAIGQGSVLATPLQLAMMTARICNGGLAVTPYLVGQPRTPARLPIDSAHLAAVMAGMVACAAPGGTAASVQIPDPNMHMAGKTGTSQVRQITLAERERGFDVFQLPWEQRHHALFVGYAPIQSPQYVVSVIIEHGGAGGAVAGPIGRDLLLRAQQRDPRQAPGQATAQSAN